jgi:hypothetical protein
VYRDLLIHIVLLSGYLFIAVVKGIITVSKICF